MPAGSAGAEKQPPMLCAGACCCCRCLGYPLEGLAPAAGAGAGPGLVSTAVVRAFRRGASSAVSATRSAHAPGDTAPSRPLAPGWASRTATMPRGRAGPQSKRDRTDFRLPSAVAPGALLTRCRDPLVILMHYDYD